MPGGRVHGLIVTSGIVGSRVSFDDWILALHVLSAFAFVAGIVLFWMLIVAVRRTDTPEGTIRWSRSRRSATSAIGIGAGGTIVLGIWLAFSYGGYDIWDGWIIAAIVLWASPGRVGQRTGAEYMQGMKKARGAPGGRPDRPERRAARAEPHADRARPARGRVASSLLLILIDMIWKPGA